MLIKLVIFSIIGGKLKIFLSDCVLPSGGFKRGKSLDEAVLGIFTKNMGFPLAESYLEQLYTFSESNGEIVVSYFVLIPEFKIPENIRKLFLEVNSLPSRFPEAYIVNYALKRLRWKIEYTNVVYSLLPPEFTFSQIQSTYEAILGRILDKRNFRKKIMALKLLEPTGHKKKEKRARPAEMFAFRKKELTFVKILQASTP